MNRLFTKFGQASPTASNPPPPPPGGSASGTATPPPPPPPPSPTPPASGTTAGTGGSGPASGSASPPTTPGSSQYTLFSIPAEIRIASDGNAYFVATSELDRVGSNVYSLSKFFNNLAAQNFAPDVQAQIAALAHNLVANGDIGDAFYFHDNDGTINWVVLTRKGGNLALDIIKPYIPDDDTAYFQTLSRLSQGVKRNKSFPTAYGWYGWPRIIDPYVFNPGPVLSQPTLGIYNVPGQGAAPPPSPPSGPGNLLGGLLSGGVGDTNELLRLLLLYSQLNKGVI